MRTKETSNVSYVEMYGEAPYEGLSGRAAHGVEWAKRELTAPIFRDALIRETVLSNMKERKEVAKQNGLRKSQS